MAIIIIALSVIIGIILYPYLPPTMITHWGLYGEPNGYSTRSFGVFFMPILMLVLYFLLKFLPSTDPYKKNFIQFKSYYDKFVVVVLGFLFYLYLLTLLANIFSFNLVSFLPPAFAVLFYYTGVLMSVARQNWFVGFRTPWTLSDVTVWNKTHILGAKLFKAVALISLLGIFLPRYALFFILLPIILVSLIIFIYSYLVYRFK